MISVNNLIKFADQHTLDDQLYMHIPQLYADQPFEVQWYGQNQWRLRELKAPSWIECNSADIVKQLTDHQLSLAAFELQLSNKLFAQVAGAQWIVDAGRELFGDAVIDDQIASYNKFKKDLISSINQILDLPKKEEKPTQLTIVKD